MCLMYFLVITWLTIIGVMQHEWPSITRHQFSNTISFVFTTAQRRSSQNQVNRFYNIVWEHLLKNWSLLVITVKDEASISSGLHIRLGFYWSALLCRCLYRRNSINWTLFRTSLQRLQRVDYLQLGNDFRGCGYSIIWMPTPFTNIYTYLNKLIKILTVFRKIIVPY